MRANIESGSFSAVSVICWKNKKLLLIEDNPACILLIKEIFCDAGMIVLSAATGQDGLKLLRQNRDTDVILLNIRLPDTDGFEVLSEINKIQLGIPVIAITADRLTWITNNSGNSGFYGFLLKPIEIDVLIKIVNIAFDYKTDNKNGEP